MSKRGSWTITVPLAAGAVLFVMFLFLPAKRQADQLRADLLQRRQFIHEAESLRPAIEKTQRELDEVQGYEQRWNGQSPNDAEIPRVYEQVNRQIQLAGTRVTRFEPTEATTLETMHLMTVNIATTGSYEQVIGMLARFEQLPRNLWLEKIHLRPGQDGENIECTATMVVIAKNSADSD